MKLSTSVVAAAYMAFALSSAALGQAPSGQSPTPPAKTTSAPAHTPAKSADAPKTDTPKLEAAGHPSDDAVDYQKFVKDLKRIDGSMTLYQKAKNIYLELPEEKLGKVFLIQAAFETGLDSMFMHPGMPLGDQAVDAFTFQRKDDMVWLERPNIGARWNDQSAFKVGAERAFPDALLNTFRVEQHDPDHKLLLINVTSLFYGDTFRLAEMIGENLGGPYQLDTARSEPAFVKGFQDNDVVQMKLHYFSPRGAEPNPLLQLLGGGVNTLEDDRSAPVRVNYTFGWRKDSGYVPRLADPRIGFFTSDFYSVDRFLEEDKEEHYICRFQLAKKDPKAALSEAVKPIVWTIDPSIPEKYRPAVKAGVLRWNKAFEALGYKNAVQVQDAPKDGDYDHADGRYNVIRMMVGPEAPFAAISLLRTDPFSGQILNASITLDGNTLQTLMEQHSRDWPIAMTDGPTRAQQILLRDPSRHMTDDKYLFESKKDEVIDEASKQMQKFGWNGELCDFASEIADQSELSWDALQGGPTESGVPPVSRDNYIDQWMSEAVCHEMGHCLGLRHNFAGSTNLTTAQLGDPKLTADQGTTASVMDYTPPNAPAVLTGKGPIFTPTVGSYDVWAVKYGYMSTDAKEPKDEKFALSQVASQSGLPGHEYLSDEDADSINPDAVRFDCAKDPLNFSAKRLVELTRARNYAVKSLPRPGESYAHRTKVVLSTIISAFREGRIAARFVGGTLGNRNFRGDADQKPTLAPVPPDTQRQAMRLIASEFLAPGSYNLPPDVMDNLSLDGDAGLDTWNAPLRSMVGSLESSLLALVMSASTTDRIAENSFKDPGGHPYTMDEHYGILLHCVWSEVGSNQDITPVRRDLQRFFLQGLMLQAGSPQGGISDDVRLASLDCLRRLDGAIDHQLAKPAGLNPLTKMHLRESKDSISRFMSRSIATSR